jgi:hypothetical protein
MEDTGHFLSSNLYKTETMLEEEEEEKEQGKANWTKKIKMKYFTEPCSKEA